jgi:hypothetical protein
MLISVSQLEFHKHLFFHQECFDFIYSNNYAEYVDTRAY